MNAIVTYEHAYFCLNDYMTRSRTTRLTAGQCWAMQSVQTMTGQHNKSEQRRETTP